MSRVVHFEIHAEDLDRAATFYTSVFGWNFKKWEGPVDYMVITTGPKEQPGINGGLIKRIGKAPVGGEPVNAFVCTMEIDNIDVYIKKALDAGGTIALDKMNMGGVGWLAYCKDTEGNIFGLLQPVTPQK